LPGPRAPRYRRSQCHIVAVRSFSHGALADDQATLVRIEVPGTTLIRSCVATF